MIHSGLVWRPTLLMEGNVPSGRGKINENRQTLGVPVPAIGFGLSAKSSAIIMPVEGRNRRKRLGPLRYRAAIKREIAQV